MKGSLERLKLTGELGFKPNCIYDGGAFIGRWAKEVHEIFPDAHVVLIEPNAAIHGEIASRTAAFAEQVTLVSKALAAEQGVAHLNTWQDQRHDNPITAMAASSVLDHVQGPAAERIEVEATTIDAIMRETGLKPDLLKLDLQGGEKFALQGAEEALAHIEMAIVEFGCLDAYVGRTTPMDLMQCFYGHGFVLYDIADFRYRPYDGAMSSGDFFFVKQDSRLKEHKDYF